MMPVRVASSSRSMMRCWIDPHPVGVVIALTVLISSDCVAPAFHWSSNPLYAVVYAVVSHWGAVVAVGRVGRVVGLSVGTTDGMVICGAAGGGVVGMARQIITSAQAPTSAKISLLRGVRYFILAPESIA